jgi:hypothetical protein
MNDRVLRMPIVPMCAAPTDALPDRAFDHGRATASTSTDG